MTAMGVRMGIEDLRALQVRRNQPDVHFVWWGEEGFAIAHTDVERASGEPLEGCALHAWLEAKGPNLSSRVFMVVPREPDEEDPEPWAFYGVYESTPLVLIDQPDDGYIEATGWVETTVTEQAAREALAEFVGDDPPQLPTGAAVREWHRPSDPWAWEEGSWFKCEPGDAGAIELWRIDCTTWALTPAVDRG